MKPQTFHILAPSLYALASYGLKELLAQLGYSKIEIINPKRKSTPQKTDYLFLMDECISLHRLNEVFQWQKLILLYSPAFPLSQAHIHNIPIKANALWHIEDLNAKTLKKMLHLLVLNQRVHSSKISKRLQLPPLTLNSLDLKILKLLAEGKHSQEISTLLHTSKSTLERHKRKLKQQLGNELMSDSGLLASLYPYGYLFF